MKRKFYIRAIWDSNLKRYYSESDIVGLHLETDTLEEFEDLIDEFSVDLIVSNHLSTADMEKACMRNGEMPVGFK